MIRKAHGRNKVAPIYTVTQLNYAWLQIGEDCIYVADIKDDADETAIMQQLYAKGMGWTETPARRGR